MAQIEKLIERFRRLPNDFTYDELKRLLAHFMFFESNAGKTSGSAVYFFRESDKRVISLHKPHKPHGNIVPMYKMKDILKMLIEGGDLHE